MLSPISSLVLFLHFANALQFDVKRSDLQISISLVQNSSSNAVDFHISMVSRFGTKGGWAALGTGHGMAGSLMFMMYTIDTKCTAPLWYLLRDRDADFSMESSAPDNWNCPVRICTWYLNVKIKDRALTVIILVAMPSRNQILNYLLFL